MVAGSNPSPSIFSCPESSFPVRVQNTKRNDREEADKRAKEKEREKSRKERMMDAGQVPHSQPVKNAPISGTASAQMQQNAFSSPPSSPVPSPTSPQVHTLASPPLAVSTHFLANFDFCESGAPGTSISASDFSVHENLKNCEICDPGTPGSSISVSHFVDLVSQDFSSPSPSPEPRRSRLSSNLEVFEPVCSSARTALATSRGIDCRSHHGRVEGFQQAW